MKYFFLILTFCFLTLPAQANDKPWVNIDTTTRIPLNIPKLTNAHVLIQNRKVSFQNGTTSQTLVDYSSSTSNYAHPQNQIFIEVADLNFDGFVDLNIYESQGYMGVNLFSKVYFFDPTQNTFIRDKLLPNACNLTKNTNEKTLEESCKSGPTFFKKRYQMHAGKLYLSEYHKEMIGPHHSFVIRYNPDGSEKARAVIDAFSETSELKPSVLKMKKATCALFNKASENTKTNFSLKENDVALLVNFKEEEALVWYEVFALIQGQPFRKWVQAECTFSSLEEN